MILQYRRSKESKPYTDIDGLLFKIDVFVDSPGPCSCRAADSTEVCSSVLGTDCSEGSFTPSESHTVPGGGGGAPPKRKWGWARHRAGNLKAAPQRQIVSCGCGCAEAQPHSPWFHTEYYAFIPLQNSKLSGTCQEGSFVLNCFFCVVLTCFGVSV